MRAGAIEPPGVHYSPSQCTTADACPRKWAFDTVWGYREEESAAAAWGTEGHAYVERLLRAQPAALPNDRTGIPERMERYYTEKLRPFLEEHGTPELHIEHQITAPFALGDRQRYWWTFLDLTFAAEGEFEGVPYQAVVLDHKTHKSMHWARSRWELQADLQMLTCAYHAPVHAEQYLLVLGQVQREGSFAHQLTKAVVTREQVEDTWTGRVLPLVEQMEEWRRDASYPGDVPAPAEGPGKAAACKAYGGCPYLDACKLAHVGRSDWDVPIAHLRKDLSVNYLNPPDSTRRPEGSPWHVIQNEEEKLHDALTRSLAPADVELLDQLTRKQIATGKTAKEVVDEHIATIVKEPQVNFLDELVSKAKSVESAPPTDDIFDAPLQEVTFPSDEVTGPVNEIVAQQVRTEAKKKGGRPKGSKNKSTVKAPDDHATHLEIALEAPAPVFESPKADAEVFAHVDVLPSGRFTIPSEAPDDDIAAKLENMGTPLAADDDTGCTLYIDCLPCEGFDGPVVHFSEFIAPVLEELSQMKIDGQGRPDPERGHSWPDWRMIPYGQGAGYIRQALKTAPLPVQLVVETRNPLVGEVIDTLRARATFVVQGTGR